MTTKRTLLAISIAFAALLGAQSAYAWDHGHARVGVGFYFGVPYGGYYYPPYPYYYPPYSPYYAPVVVQQQPQVYVEQQPAPQAQQPAGYWYYCADSRAYYPYVKECRSEWQRVSPHPG